MRVVGKTKALGALAGIPRACNEGGSAQRVTSGTQVSTAARRRQIARPRQQPVRFDRALSWQLDAALYLEETAGRYGLITMCIGGGMGAAGIIERC